MLKDGELSSLNLNNIQYAILSPDVPSSILKEVLKDWDLRVDHFKKVHPRDEKSFIQKFYKHCWTEQIFS